MATAGIFNGTNLNVYLVQIEDEVEVLYPLAHATSCEISFTHSPREATTKDSAGDTARLPGKRDWSLSTEALFALDYATADDKSGITELYAALKVGTKLKVKFTSNIIGDYEFNGYCYLSDISVNAGVEENASYSASFAGTGAITRDEIPDPEE